MTPDERAELIELWRQRQVLLRSEGDMTRRIKALARRVGKPVTHPVVFLAAEPFVRAKDILHKSKRDCENRLKALARKEPVWDWAKDVRGIGPLTVAAILAEAGGDLGKYATHSKLWKRFGLALAADGKAQRRQVGAIGALEGFSPERRQLAHYLALSVLRSQTPTVGPYRAIYDQRKRWELAKVASKGHAEARTLRYLAKKLLRDMWAADKRLASAGL